MLTGPNVILTLKVAVAAVTVLLLLSLVALWRGHYWLHGRINLVFFTLTLVTVLGLETIIHVIDPTLFRYIEDHPQLARALRIHLCFSVPSALLMPAMLYTGLTRRRTIHLALAWVFGTLWLGTVVTGIFFLPHTETP
ncbi:hypothetical protein AYO44_17785 [Planctomycetaceae bacterium SCGC AG-212-F19]|nr:hypothetical protein AYO44_17785 [Planctomycetaceae bacterium SCGC AG-212-F19]